MKIPCALLVCVWPLAAEKVVTFATDKQPEVEVHVSLRGDDRSGDGTAGNPFRTIARGVKEAKAGTAVRIHPGVYRGGVHIAGLAGTEAKPIWIGGLAGRERPVIEGGGSALHLSKVRYVVVHDLEVRKSRHNGINCDDGGEYANPDATRHMVFRDLLIHEVGDNGNQDGLKLSGVDDFVVLGCRFGRCGRGSGIDMVGCHEGRILHSEFQGLAGNAIQCKGGTRDILIRSNYMKDFGQRSVNIGGSTGFAYFRPPLSASEPNVEARDVHVVGNVFEGGTAPVSFASSVDCVVRNNTIIDPERWLVRILQETKSTEEDEFVACGDHEVSNNIFHFNRSRLSTCLNIGPNTRPETVSYSHNLWFAHDAPARSDPGLSMKEPGAVMGKDPRFRTADGHKVHLAPDSPAIGAGKAVNGEQRDYSGGPFRNPPSIGALEFRAG